jgi:GDP-4-dehydro-6-deoxy-D-mannose reductase
LTGYASADLRRGWPIGVPLDADVVHLAGLAAVGPSFDSPREYIDGNSAMVTSMCEALLSAGFTGRVVGVSTGAVYAQEEEVARIETDPVAYTSPYVVSKVLTENPAYYAPWPAHRRGAPVQPHRSEPGVGVSATRSVAAAPGVDSRATSARR